MIAFLHTATTHIETFESLLRESAPDLPSRHEVDADLLAEAREGGVLTPALARRLHEQVAALADEGACVVVCTCSTLGAAVDASVVPGVAVMRADRPMAQSAVALGQRIVVVATLASTLAPTRELLHEVAAREERSIHVSEVVCEDAWRHFTSGEISRYAAEVAAGVERAARLGDVVVMAQASMAVAEDLVVDVGVPVLASPRLAVEAALRAHRLMARTHPNA